MDNEIKVGDRVRSYDFPHTRTYYVEGEVIYIGDNFVQGGDHHVRFECPRYVVRVDRAVQEGEEVAVWGSFAFPPVNGTLTTFGRTTNNVEKLA